MVLKINWDSNETMILLNDRMPQHMQEFLRGNLPVDGKFKRHFWLVTSGSTASPGSYKCIALSKDAMLASAESVNGFLESTFPSNDRWLNPLPAFHVGGLAILARGYLSNAQVYIFEEKWNPISFYQQLSEQKTTLTSLVPTQLYDLLSHSLPPPSSLRAVLVGGGKLEQNLYEQAKHAHWPILPTYGLTEASSSVAIASLTTSHPSLRILDHFKVRIDQKGFIHLKGPSLLSAIALVTPKGVDVYDPITKDGWFCSEDKGVVSGQFLSIEGRGGDFVKIGGESVDLNHLEAVLQKIKNEIDCHQASVFVPITDIRLGHVIHLVIEGELKGNFKLQQALDLFQNSVLPFERFRSIHEFNHFPRSALGKVLKGEIIALINESPLIRR